MAVYEVASPMIVYKDVLDIKRLYLLIRDFLHEEGYTDPFGGDDFLETFYQEQRAPGNRKHIRYWWRSATTASGGSSYFKYTIDLDVTILNMQDVDIVRNNQKLHAQQAEVHIKILGKLHKDYKHFMDVPYLRPFKLMYEKLWKKKEIEYHWLKVLDDVQKLETEIKTHLNLVNFGGEREPFLERF